MRLLRFSAPFVAPFFAVAGLLAAISLTTGTAHAQFTDNFNSFPNGQNDPNFGNDSGGWFVQNGVYTSNPTIDFSFSTLIAPGYTNLADTTMTFDLIDAADSGAILRSDAGGSNGLVVIVRPSQGDFYFIQRSGGSFGSILSTASIAGIVTSGDDLRVTYSSSGNSFTASIASLSDPSTTLRTINYTAPGGSTIPAAGRIGFYQYRPATVKSGFDNLSVTNDAAAAPEPGSIALLAGGGVAPLLGSMVRRRRSRRS